MPGSYESADILCPFFKYTDKVGNKRRIVCEGLYDDGALAWILKKADFDFHIEEYCKKNYRHCEMADMLRKAMEDE